LLYNIAVNKPCQQSSLSRWSRPGDANRVVSIDVRNEFAFHTSDDDRPWWKIDLQSEYLVCEIKVHNRKSSIKAILEKSTPLKIEVSVDSEIWNDVYDNYNVFGCGTDCLVVNFNTKLVARYVRLSLREKNYFHLSKVEIFSYATDAKNSEINAIYKPNLKANLKSVVGTRVGILGTSNSRKNQGYVSVLKSCFDTIFNVSVGSSHPVIAAEALKNLNGGELDILLVDFCVNEQRAINGKCYNEEKAFESYKFIASWCYEHDVIPIFLVLPHLHCFKGIGHPFRARTLIKDFCQKYNLMYFDVYHLLEDQVKTASREFDSYFEDPAHISNYYSHRFGESLAKQITELHLAKLKGLLALEYVEESGYKIEAIPYNFSNKVRRHNSTIDVNYSKLEIGDTQYLHFDGLLGLWGISLNMAKTHCSLVINSNENKLVKRLDNIMYDPNRDIWHAAWQINTDVSFENHVELAIVQPQLGHELNDHSVKIDPDRMPEAELLNLFFAKKQNLKVLKLVSLNLK
jgi:hypothetical protein